MTVALIASGQFIRSSLAAEFGDLPPSFLPLGNRRLYTRQIEFLRTFTDNIFISLPNEFVLPKWDEDILRELGAAVIRSKSSLTLGEAIAFCANVIGSYDDSLIVLYGDTIIDQPELSPDCYTMHATSEHQSWALAPIGKDPIETPEGPLVISGLFSFSDVPLLLRSISLADGDFMASLVTYDLERPLAGSTAGKWFDFGHVQTYYTSCGLITTERSFNRVSISATAVEKLSDDALKMEAEARWFENIPPALRTYTPAFLGRIERDGRKGYRTGNTYLATLANLAVFGNLDAHSWRQIFEACDRFLFDASQYRTEGHKIETASYYQEKTEQRLQSLDHWNIHEIDKPLVYDGRAVPSMLEMAHVSGQLISEHPSPEPCVIHGDFCFSNIFYDFRSRSIKVIDPRGHSPDRRVSIYGDPRYDAGKLAHSVVGAYDMIIAGRMTGVCNSGHLSMNMSALSWNSWSEILTAYDKSDLSKRYPTRLIDAILVQLFLSMLPLHSDAPARQRAFLANAARFFLSLEI